MKAAFSSDKEKQAIKTRLRQNGGDPDAIMRHGGWHDRSSECRLLERRLQAVQTEVGLLMSKKIPKNFDTSCVGTGRFVHGSRGFYAESGRAQERRVVAASPVANFKPLSQANSP